LFLKNSYTQRHNFLERKQTDSCVDKLELCACLAMDGNERGFRLDLMYSLLREGMMIRQESQRVIRWASELK